MATTSQTFTDLPNVIGAQTWTCPAGVSAIQAEVWAEGGPGHGNDGSGFGAGGSGGGAYSKRYYIPVTPGKTYNVNRYVDNSPIYLRSAIIGESGITCNAEKGIGGIEADGGAGGLAANGNGDEKTSGSNGATTSNANGGAGGAGGNGGAGGAGGTSGSRTGGVGTSPGGGAGGNYANELGPYPKGGDSKTILTWTIPTNISVCTVS